MNKAKNIRLGLFVSTGIILFILAIYFLGRQQNLFGSTFRVNAVFVDVKGLQVGNNVRFSGINVGTITNIAILTDSTVKVELSLKNDVREFIKKDSKATISSEGLLGNKIVKIFPGSPESETIQEQDLIQTLQPVDFDDILKEVKTSSENISVVSDNLIQITDKINRGEGMFGKIFTDTTMTANLDKASKNINMITAEISVITEKVNQGQGILGKLLTDTAFSKSLSMSGRSFEQASNNLEEITAKINQGEGIFGKMFTDTIMSNSLNATFDNLNKTTENTKMLTRNLVMLSNEINKGNGIVSKLVSDSVFTDSIEQTIQQINKSAREISEAAKAIEKSWLIRATSKDDE